jgi:hypothetical protein
VEVRGIDPYLRIFNQLKFTITGRMYIWYAFVVLDRHIIDPRTVGPYKREKKRKWRVMMEMGVKVFRVLRWLDERAV